MKKTYRTSTHPLHGNLNQRVSDAETPSAASARERMIQRQLSQGQSTGDKVHTSSINRRTITEGK